MTPSWMRRRARRQTSSDRKRPRFHRGPLQMIGWMIALVYNAVGDFASALPGDFVGCHVRTLRRMFFDRPGTLYQTPEARSSIWTALAAKTGWRR